jgi:hypothetical protein
VENHLHFQHPVVDVHQHDEYIFRRILWLQVEFCVGINQLAKALDSKYWVHSKKKSKVEL